MLTLILNPSHSHHADNHLVYGKQEHTEAFEELKNMLSSDTVLAYFDPQEEHELHVDGCPMGVVATLTQRKPGEQIWQVVQYASRSLTDTEKRYSQIELHCRSLSGGFLVAKSFTCSCTGYRLRW